MILLYISLIFSCQPCLRPRKQVTHYAQTQLTVDTHQYIFVRQLRRTKKSYIFLVADMVENLMFSYCPSVRPSVRPSVGLLENLRTRYFENERTDFDKITTSGSRDKARNDQFWDQEVKGQR